MGFDVTKLNTARLEVAFPPIRIELEGLKTLRLEDAWRLADELECAEMIGLTWIDITSSQARATVDVLKIITHASLPVLLPGYLKFVSDVSLADNLVVEVPRLLEETAAKDPCCFDARQREALVDVLTDAATRLEIADHQTLELLQRVAHRYANNQDFGL